MTGEGPSSHVTHVLIKLSFKLYAFFVLRMLGLLVNAGYEIVVVYTSEVCNLNFFFLSFNLTSHELTIYKNAFAHTHILLTSSRDSWWPPYPDDFE